MFAFLIEIFPNDFVIYTLEHIFMNSEHRGKKKYNEVEKNKTNKQKKTITTNFTICDFNCQVMNIDCDIKEIA